jgi:hypothetical protein
MLRVCMATLRVARSAVLLMATIIAYIVLFHIVPINEGRSLNIMNTRQAQIKLVFDGTIKHALSTILTKVSCE